MVQAMNNNIDFEAKMIFLSAVLKELGLPDTKDLRTARLLINN